MITDIDSTCISSYSSFEDYYKVFHKFVEQIERDGKFIYKASDENLQKLATGVREDVTAMPYEEHAARKENGQIILKTRFGDYILEKKEVSFSLKLFLEYVNGIRLVCRQLGIQDKDFYASVGTPVFNPQEEREVS